MGEIHELLRQAQQRILDNASHDTAAVLREARKLAALAWLSDAFYFYRQLDFFAATPRLSDTKLIEQWVGLNAEDEEASDNVAATPMSQGDRETFLLMSDTSRIWSNDLECDVCEANRSYTVFLHDLAAISRGLFVPENIAEEWVDMPTKTHNYGAGEVQEGRIHVFFTCSEEPFYFEPDFHVRDRLDITSPLQTVNQALQPTGFQFELLEFEGLIGLVLLSASEKSAMEKRGISFFRFFYDHRGKNHHGLDGDFDNFDPFEDE